MDCIRATAWVAGATAQRRVVRGSHEVQRATHRGDTNHGALVQRRGELRAVERLQPRPQSDERWSRDLCLHADESLDGNRRRWTFSRSRSI
jgi:hypothetical protein